MHGGASMQLLIQCGVAALVVLGPVAFFAPSVVDVAVDGTSNGTLYIYFTGGLFLSLALQFLCVRGSCYCCRFRW